MRSALLPLLLLVTLPARAATPFVSGEVSASAEWTVSQALTGGYAALPVELESHADAKTDVVVQLAGYSKQVVVRRAVTLDPGEKRTVFLPAPAAVSRGELTVSADGMLLPGSLAVNVIGERGGTTLTCGPLPTGQHIPTEGPRDELDPRFMPDLLAGYVGYAHVVLVAPATQLSQPARAALEQYVRTGGDLILSGAAAEAPMLDGWHADLSFDHASLGLGTIESCPDLATCSAFDRPAPTSILDSRQPSRRPSGLLPDLGHAPVGVFVVIILAFAIAIGPVNFAFAKRRGRHLMLVTIPLLAATTCGGIASYGVVKDGLFTSHFAARSVTDLDDDAHLASTVALVAHYAALAPARVTYAPATAVLFEPRMRDRMTLDWTSGETFSDGYLPSRTLRQRYVATVTPSRARVVVDGTTLENALGGDIVRGFVRLGDRTYSFGKVAEGASAELRSATFDPHAFDAESALLASPLVERATRPLLPGDFVALVRNAPFAPTGGLRVTNDDVLGLVRGGVSR